MGWWTEPSNSLARRSPLHHRVEISWQPPPSRELKFNVDGSVKGKQGPASCGGVLHNSDGLVVGIFFSPLRLCDSNFAELMAILKAIHLFVASLYANCPITIESDSKVALLWVKSLEQRPWDKWHIFNELDSLSFL